MVAIAAQINLSGLARQLVGKGLLSEAVARRAETNAERENLSLIRYLVRNRMVSAKDIAQSCAQDFGLPLIDLDTVDLDEVATDQAYRSIIEKHHVLPLFKRGSRLFVALSDPTHLTPLDEIKFQTGLQTEAVLVEADKLDRAIREVTRESDVSIDELMGGPLGADALFEDRRDHNDAGGIEDAAVVRLVNKILLDAVRMGASDIHFEPYDQFYRVRYRQDGILREGERPPPQLAERVAARIKVLSKLDISERRVPQDGRIKMKLSKSRAIDFRINTCPTLFGEKVCLRILDPGSAALGIDRLGYEPDQQQLLMDALSKPQGLILVTGPTGSGKTVSLYAALNLLNQATVNISTVEDPAEINLPGVNQVNVNQRVGLTFAAALRSFLRQDPDIIMVGEIRDTETGEIAIKAAQTGHLVLSTLHTNDAPQTINRLVNMGIPPYNIAASLNLVIAQRLVRRLCNHCKQAIDIPKKALAAEGLMEQELESTPTFYKPVGCPQCVGGYKGRVGIYQVMPVSEGMQRIILAGGHAMDLAAQAEKEGVADLRKSGMKKVLQGITSLEEVHRVTTD